MKATRRTVLALGKLGQLVHLIDMVFSLAHHTEVQLVGTTVTKITTAHARFTNGQATLFTAVRPPAKNATRSAVLGEQAPYRHGSDIPARQAMGREIGVERRKDATFFIPQAFPTRAAASPIENNGRQVVPPAPATQRLMALIAQREAAIVAVDTAFHDPPSRYSNRRG